MGNPNPSYKFPKGNKANPKGTNRAKELAQLRREDRARAVIVEWMDKNLKDILQEFADMNPNACKNATAWKVKIDGLTNLLQYVTPKMSANANANMDFANMKPEQVVEALRVLKSATAPAGNETKVIDITPETLATNE